MSIFFTPAPAPASTASTNPAAFNTVVTLTGSSTLSTAYATYYISNSTGNTNLTLPAPNATYRFTIKKTAANTNTITLVRNGSETIDLIAANYTLSGSNTSELCAWGIASDGTNWFII